MPPKARSEPEEEDTGPRWEHEDTGPAEVWNEFDRHERERVLLTTRIPSELFFRLKQLAIRSTLQILTEHAYTLYLGRRLPPDLWGGYEWPEEFPTNPPSPYLSSKPRLFSARIPRSLLRWSRVWAVQAEMSEQELAVKVFDWYVRKGLIPPPKEVVRRSLLGLLDVGEPLIALRFMRYTPEQIQDAMTIMIERHERYGGSLRKSRSRM